MKPLDGNFAKNALKHGVSGLNIDGCRVGISAEDRAVVDSRSGAGYGTIQCDFAGRDVGEKFKSHDAGRFPANLIHDGSSSVVELFPEGTGAQAPVLGTEPSHTGQKGIYGKFNRVAGVPKRDNLGSAARFFKEAKEK